MTINNKQKVKLRICSYNIQWCKNSRPVDIALLLESNNIDIAFIQEIDNLSLRNDRINIFEEIKSYSKFKHSFFFRTLFFRDGGEYGLGVFSKIDIKEINFYNLSFQKDEPRIYICGKIELNNEEITIFLTHLSKDTPVAQKQFEYIYTKTKSIDGKWLIVGDLNLETNFFNKFNVSILDNSFTWPSEKPIKRIDHILSNFEMDVHTINISLSDHLPIIADFF